MTTEKKPFEITAINNQMEALMLHLGLDCDDDAVRATVKPVAQSELSKDDALMAKDAAVFEHKATRYYVAHASSDMDAPVCREFNSNLWKIKAEPVVASKRVVVVAQDWIQNARFDPPDAEHTAWVRARDVMYGHAEPDNDQERGMREGMLKLLATVGPSQRLDLASAASKGLVAGSIRIGAGTAEAFRIDDDTYTVEVALVDGRLAYYGGDGQYPYLPKEDADELASYINTVGAVAPSAWLDGNGYPLAFPAAARRELERERELEDDRSGFDHGM